jgi:molecular chaperone GrpE (heat shock protein)
MLPPDAEKLLFAIERLDAKLCIIHRDTEDVVKCARGAVDSRFQNALASLLRCCDTVRDPLLRASAETSAILDVIAADLDAVLESLGIERFALSTFDPSLQRVISSEPTVNEASDGLIARSLRDGYKSADRIERSQYVIVYKKES